MRTPRAAGFIASFKVTPLEIFRVNKGPSIFLREWAAFPPQRFTIFDLHTYEGKVLPKALNKATYQLPNGASMRPNGRYQQALVRRLAGRDWIVYSIPKDTPLPEELILVHEHTDHYSMQPAIEMSLEDLNQQVTQFLQTNGTLYTTEHWLSTYKLPSWSTKKAYGSRSVMDNNTFIG
ncbi:uncharacterized protein K444DRAFT_587759 [Hyaloscypha bicolor E]|uniref:Tse2 ADP-ribosyltransferase toxin domain-containing protein n=1 Tax=Hyaloscypha bicolor E TaxID=1095630 RepID=A0A2J6TEZ5_9HELO|nr:uncharacterized protein K444DRAFT_587759 [Hyaloscypha bicolor E]PMD61573.1 hypothetical protein K444DRAFT_587759 [Hyaloscypha bicolor E]